MGKIRGLLFLSLVVSSPSWAEDTYVCLLQGTDVLNPFKLKIDYENGEVTFPSSPIDGWKFENKSADCHLHNTDMMPNLGYVYNWCFSTKNNTMTVSSVAFNIESEKPKSELFLYRCVEID